MGCWRWRFDVFCVQEKLCGNPSIQVASHMSEFVLIHRAVQESNYTARHISMLLRSGAVKGRKEGHIWLVDLEDFKRYVAAMQAEGPKKFDPTKYKKQKTEVTS